MNSKPWYTSKTLWFNVLAFIAAVVASFGYSGQLPAEWEQYVGVAVALANILLRLVTKQPVTLRR
uniref:Holin n=1 Tax=viral metagenome TaxID=1070528 RepID=A0A6M3XEU6_9ZZZZ